MKNTVMLILLLLITAFGARAGELKEIELTDGSVITGEVISLSKGVYSIRTESLGSVTVNESRVRTIRAKGSGAPSAAEVSSLTEKMMSDSEIMAMIESLKSDPAFQKALEDPAILKAVSAGDTAALMANPKFLELMNNATVHDIQKKVQK